MPDGALALVLGKPGVGKTAFLVHAALEALVGGQQVLHVAQRESVGHVRAHYDEIVRLLEERAGLSASAVDIERARMVHTTRGQPLDVPRLAEHLDLLANHADFTPRWLVVDGLAHGPELGAQLEALASVAGARGARLWVAVDSEAPLPEPLFATAALVVRLVDVPGDSLRLQRVHGPGHEEGVPVVLDPVTLFVAEEGEPPQAVHGRLNPADCTLYSGGAAGSEALFGEVAAEHGVREVAFTFEGHLQARTVGRRELTEEELAMGDVSLGYVSRRLNRSYSDQAGLIRGVLQTLWHMVHRSVQVFVVGEILDDGTVRGGTGWGVELARMWDRELWVFDTRTERWHTWAGSEWREGEPQITAPAFCGTGTRKVDARGRAAVEALFAASFGPPR